MPINRIALPGLVCLICFGISGLRLRAQTTEGPAPEQVQGQDQSGDQSQDQAAPAQAPPKEPQRPQYLDLRYDEDWTHINEVPGPHDFFDPIKYILLNDQGWYMSLGGEIRERYDSWHNADFSLAPGPFLNGLFQRYLFHADTHFGEHFRFFTQIESSLENGKKGGPWYTDRDVFEFHQFFFDYKSSEDPNHYTRLRVGRQEVALGTDHFMATADWINVRRSMDGVQLVVARGPWIWIAFAAKPVLIDTGPLTALPEHRRTTYGGALFGPNPWSHQGRTTFFWTALDSKDQQWWRGTGRDNRQTLGARIEGSKKGWDYTYEAISQLGTFSPIGGPSVPIHAFGVTSDTGWTAAKLQPHYLRVGVVANITSGDGGTGALGTFHPLFPDLNYSGKLGLVGPTNVISVTPSLRYTITPRIFLLSEWDFFWRENTHDAIYSPSLQTTTIDSGIVGFITFPSLDNKRYIGNQPGNAVQFTIDRHSTYTISYAPMFAGAFIKDAKGKDVSYLTMWYTYRF
jgi:hypothetical protein